MLRDESLSISDLYKVKYQGIRPAVGYPSLPDQLLNYTLDKLLDMSQMRRPVDGKRCDVPDSDG